MERSKELELIVDGCDYWVEVFLRKARKAKTSSDRLFYESKAQEYRKLKRIANKERYDE